jgi:O-antigen ligase
MAWKILPEIMNHSIAQTAKRMNGWMLPLLAFSLPVSTSAVTVLALFIVFIWLVEGDFRRKIEEIFTNKVSIAVLVFLGLYVVGLLWSADRGAGMEMFGKQWKLLMMPVFLTVLPLEHRRRVSNFFLAGLVVMMAATYLAWFDILHYGGVTPDHPTRKLFHVVYNPMLAFGFYLVMHDVLWGKMTAGWRTAMAVLALAMAFNMFIPEGRAGQVAFFALLTLLHLQYFRKNILWGALLAAILLPLLFTAGYKLSPTFHNRVSMGWEEVAQFNTNPNTSIGLRLQFWKNSWEIIKQNPLIGVGTCDFQSAYAEVNSVLSPGLVATDNPHNQYFLVWCQLGIIGFAALLGIFFMQIRQAFTVDDAYKRIRLAFPLFFLVIMLSESYLIVYETAFLFALFSAVFYKKEKSAGRGAKGKNSERCWLILSYRANLDGSACAQHIDDRLPFFLQRGIVPVLLSGTIGARSNRWPHFRTCSIAPSGIRFELRHYLRKRYHKRWQFMLMETILLLPVFPFYLLEKILVNFESEWSWFFVSSIRGYFLCRRFKPEVVYSTGGSASAHIAGWIISRLTGLPWLAETQDPLVHDHDWRRGKRVLAVYKWLEKRICVNADVFLFLARAARENMAARAGMPGCGRVIYPGADPAMFQSGLYEKDQRCHFAHFGTLNGTRNLVVFFKALRQLMDRDRLDSDIVRVDVFGSLDEGSKKAVAELELQDVVTNHGAVTRKEALVAMQKSDCLLLIQNTIFFSSETIPSKVYEYMLSGRPILGLVHHNHELESMLRRSGNFPVPADQVEPLADAVEKIVAMFRENGLSEWTACHDWTVSQAVDQLLQLGEEAARRIR